MFTSIILSLDIAITGNVDEVETTIEDAKQYCLVLNSLRVPVVIETQVRTPEGEADPIVGPIVDPIRDRRPHPAYAAAAGYDQRRAS
jgi:hypothetical protein